MGNQRGQGSSLEAIGRKGAHVADIDVTFGTNAPAVAAQIDQATNSTARATTAATAHNSATKQEAVALKAAAAAAREKAAAANAEAAANLKAANAARQRAVQGAGFLGAGRFATGAQALVGKDAGIGELVRTTALLAGVGVAIGMLIGAIEKWWNKADEQIKVTEDATKAYVSIRESNIQRGINAADSMGKGLTRATALGFRGDINKIAAESGFRVNDVSGAVASAAGLFPGRETQAIGIATTVARVLGEDLKPTLEKMKGMRLGEGSEASLATRVLGRRVGVDEFTEMQARVGASREVANFAMLDTEKAQTDLFDLSQVSRAASEAMQRNLEMINAEADARARALEEYKNLEAMTHGKAKGPAKFIPDYGPSLIGFGVP